MRGAVRSAFLQNCTVVFGCLLLGFALVVWADKLSPVLLLAFPIAAATAIMVVHQPFLGLAALVFFPQVDAFTKIIFAGLPISGLKILAVLTLAGLIFTYKNRSAGKQDIPAPVAAKFVVLLILALLISVVLAHDQSFALSDLRRFAGIVLLCYLVVALTDTTKRFEILLLAIMGSTILSSLVVIYDWAFHDNLFAAQRDIQDAAVSKGGYRSSGASIRSAPMVATMFLCGISMAAIFYLRTSRWRIFTAATLVIGSLGLFFNSTRSASITYAILLVWLIFKFRKSRILPILFFGSIFAALILLPLVPADYWDRMLGLFDPGRDWTLYRRMSYHIVGWDLFEKFPIFGIGFGNFPLFFVDFDYRWIPGRTTDADGLKQLHNQYLQIAAESGIVALACYLGLLGSCLGCLSQVRKKAASVRIGVIAEALQFSFVGLLIQLAFLSNKQNKYLWIHIGLVIALYYINKAASRENGGKNEAISEPESA